MGKQLQHVGAPDARIVKPRGRSSSGWAGGRRHKSRARGIRGTQTATAGPSITSAWKGLRAAISLKSQSWTLSGIVDRPSSHERSLSSPWIEPSVSMHAKSQRRIADHLEPARTAHHHAGDVPPVRGSRLRASSRTTSRRRSGSDSQRTGLARTSCGSARSCHAFRTGADRRSSGNRARGSDDERAADLRPAARLTGSGTASAPR